MSVLVPRLWPFLSHSTSSVRKSTLLTLRKLTENRSTDASVIQSCTKPQCSQNIEPISLMPGGSGLEKIIDVDKNMLSLNFGVMKWPAQLLQDAMRHIFQRVLVEHLPDIQCIAEDVWTNLVTNADLSALLHAACPYVASWMCLAMQPARLAFDPSLMIYARANPTSAAKEQKNRFPEPDSNQSISSTSTENMQPKFFLGGIETTPFDVRERNIPSARCKAAKLIGLLSKYLILPAPGVNYTSEMESPIDCYTKLLLGYLSSRSALQRIISGLVISFWAEYDASARPGPPILQDKLKTALNEYVYYDEVAFMLTRLLQESRDFIATLKQYKVPFNDFDNCKILTLDQIQALSSTMTDNLKLRFTHLKPKVVDLLDERRRGLYQSYLQTNAEQNGLNVRWVVLDRSLKLF